MGELPRVLKVRVIKGLKLLIKDRVMSSDPYVIIKLGKHTKKTTVKRRSLNPLWDEEFTFTITAISHHDLCSLTAEVWDHDTFSRDDFMGSAEIDLKPLFHELYPIANGKKVLAKSSSKYLDRDSYLIDSRDGTRVQPLCLKLGGDEFGGECGVLELRLEWQGLS